MYWGMRWGDPYGSVDAQAIYAQIDVEQPLARTLSWTPEHDAGVVHHVMIDQVQYARTAETSRQDFPQDARDHIEVIETSDQNWDEDVTDFASSPSDRVELTWTEVAGADYYELYRKVSGGAYGDPLAVIDAGESSYKIVDGPLTDAVYVYKLAVYDAAGNTVDSNEPEVTVSAAPEAPSDLTVTVT